MKAVAWPSKKSLLVLFFPDQFNICFNCIVLIASTTSTTFGWRNTPNVLNALQRDRSSKDDHCSFDERRQIFSLNVWELQHLNSALFAWTERRIQLYGLQTCTAWAWPCWNSTVCGGSEHVGGLHSHNKLFTGAVMPAYVRSLDSQVRKFCLVKYSSSCLCR